MSNKEWVRVILSGKDVAEGLVSDVPFPTIPCSGERITITRDGVKTTFLVVSRSFDVELNTIAGSDEWGELLGPVKVLLFVDELANESFSEIYPTAKRRKRG